MQNNNNHIDNFFKKKADEQLTSKNFAAVDFEAIKANLPTGPVMLPNANPTKWMGTKILLGIITIIAIITTVYFAKNEKATNKKNIPNNTSSTFEQNKQDTNITTAKNDTTNASIKPTAILKVDTASFKKKNILVTLKLKLYNKNENKNTIVSYFEGLRSQVQLYDINTYRDTIIKCTKGTNLFIQANCFTTTNKLNINGMVQMQIKEAYQYTDIIAHGLHTTSNSNLLESAGMVFINATQNNVALDININKPIKLYIPFKTKKSDMQLFYLNKNANDDNINSNTTWIANGQVQNATWSKAKIMQNTIPIEENNSLLDRGKVMYTDSRMPSDTNYIASEKTYQFAIRNFGWINCDRFSYIENKTNLNIEIDNELDSSYYRGVLIFPKLKSVINLINTKNTFTQYNLPLGEEAYLVAFKTTNGKVFTNIQKIKITKETIKARAFKNIPTNQVKATLDDIGSVD